jgi:hypothetical protein
LLVEINGAEGSAAEAGAERHGGLGPRPIPASPGRLNRSVRTPLAFRCAAAAAILLAGACGREAPARVAGRVLEHYRKTAALRPRPEAGSVRLRLAPVEASGDGSGTAEIEWEGRRYRETVASAGATTVRGIQGNKAFFIDEDGVTRVGSEPMLAELVTRSYFWRRAYLFEDHERAKLSLGLMDAATSSVSVRPLGGDDLVLVFDREGDSLLRAEAPRLRLEFDGPSRFRDTSRRPVAAEIAWNGLPTRRLPDPVVGGWLGQFSEPSAEATLTGGSAGVSLPAEVAGLPVRLAIDADVDGPLRISPDAARRAGLAGRRDIFGRLLAGGVSLKIGPLSMSPLFVEIADSGEEGIDAVAGGTLFRETVVEVDPKAGRIRFHDPASWVVPAGFARSVIDDDGNVPVSILFRSGRRLRLRTGTRTAAPLELAARTAAELGLDRDSPLSGLVWGTLRLPPVPTRVAGAGFDPEWGDDGALGWPLVKQFHVFVDLPHRWIYVRPA